MHGLNKVLVVLGVLIALPLGIALLVAPLPLLEAVTSGLQGVIVWLKSIPALVRLLLGILFALAWMVLCILFLILELRRPPRRMVRVERVDGGMVEVSLNTVAEHIAHALEQLPGVVRARPRALARRKGVAVEVEVDIASDVALPAQASQLVEVIRQTVEEKVGVRIAEPPQVRLHAVPAPTVVRRPVGGPPSPGNP